MMIDLFECKICGFTKEYKEFESPSKCPNCNVVFYRLSTLKELGAKSKSRWGANHPRWSWSMGVNIQDIPKMMKQYPDRKYNPVTGQLLVENRSCKKRLMKEHGMFETG